MLYILLFMIRPPGQVPDWCYSIGNVDTSQCVVSYVQNINNIYNNYSTSIMTISFNNNNKYFNLICYFVVFWL